MSTTTKRTRLKAVYLTDTERDLVRMALREMGRATGFHGMGQSYWEIQFAKSFTAKRLAETAALFEDKATGEPS